MTGLALEDVPRLPRGVKLHFDAVRGKHVLLAPERAFNVDETAAAIVRLVDGTRSVSGIIDALAEAYAERREVIEKDVVAMLDDLFAKRVLDR